MICWENYEKVGSIRICAVKLNGNLQKGYIASLAKLYQLKQILVGALCYIDDFKLFQDSGEKHIITQGSFSDLLHRQGVFGG